LLPEKLCIIILEDEFIYFTNLLYVIDKVYKIGNIIGNLVNISYVMFNS